MRQYQRSTKNDNVAVPYWFKHVTRDDQRAMNQRAIIDIDLTAQMRLEVAQAHGLPADTSSLEPLICSYK